MNRLDSHLVEARKPLLQYLSAYHFLRKISVEKQWHTIVYPSLLSFQEEQSDLFIYEIIVEGKKHQFLVKYLAWDSNFFQIPSYKLFTVLYAHNSFGVLEKAVKSFKKAFFEKKADKYLSIEIPHEDILLIQALTSNKFRLIESRVNYYKDNIADFQHERYGTRATTIDDIPNIRKVAIEARNDYDRVHADIQFNAIIADTYLATYAENAVKGFAKIVLVPNEPTIPTDAFLAIGLHNKDGELLGSSFARIMLTAVLPTCKGWHYRLMAETIQYAKANSLEYVLMTTQVTNKAVFRNAFKLGFEIGNITHILAC